MPDSERAQYEALLATAEEAERRHDEAVDAFMTYLRAHGTRAAEKPWEICGNLDAFGFNEETDEGWFRVQCQFPKDHQKDLGIRYHYDDGNEWSSGTWPAETEYPFREADPTPGNGER